MFNCERHILFVPVRLWKFFFSYSRSTNLLDDKLSPTLDHDVDLNLVDAVEVDVCLQVLLADKLAATSDCSCLRLWILPKGDLFATLDMEVSVLRIVMIRAKTNIWKCWKWQQDKNNSSCPRGPVSHTWKLTLRWVFWEDLKRTKMLRLTMVERHKW